MKHGFKKGHKGYKVWLGKKRPEMTEEKSPFWKGDNIGYSAIHKWVKRWKGKADHCENCGSQEVEKEYQWANIDHKYRRVLEDYISMCVPCHIKYDKTVISK